MSIPDPVRDGLARGWKVYGGPHSPAPAEMTCDVAVVGTGAGAGITAELLTQAGLDVILVEEGPLRSSSDFRQRESDAYPDLYQESAGRKTADKAINILQGRCVGGSTTVNWTSSFRTPEDTLQHWHERYGLPGSSTTEMAAWFDAAERRLSIGPWLAAPNRNNELLRQGALKLGIAAESIQRNVKGCWNLGSCGMGCPTNAKQSMLVTTIPAALDRGARLLVQTRAHAFEHTSDKATALSCVAVSLNGAPLASRVRIVARHFVVSGGAINSPALLKRSDVPDPHGLLGTRTFLHPVVISAATFGDRVEAWAGAPQTLYTDHFLKTQPLTGSIGYKLEAPPMHPVIFSTTLAGHGQAQTDMLAAFPRSHSLLALMRDGFHPSSPGGTVQLQSDGTPRLEYDLNEFVMDGARRAFLSMAEIQFAAGAQTVVPVHELASPYSNWAAARAAIAELPMRPLLTRVVSAHVMGGCAMAGTERQGVVNPDGTHWQIGNLSVHDGSIFPTSIGANPQLSVYGFATKLATGLAKRLTGRDVHLA